MRNVGAAWTLLKPAVGKADETPGPSDAAQPLNETNVAWEGGSSVNTLPPEMQPTMPPLEASAGTNPAPPALEAPPPPDAAPLPKSLELRDEDVKKLLKEAEDDRRKSLRRRKKGRIHELEEVSLLVSQMSAQLSLAALVSANSVSHDVYSSSPWCRSVGSWRRRS